VAQYRNTQLAGHIAVTADRTVTAVGRGKGGDRGIGEHPHHILRAVMAEACDGVFVLELTPHAIRGDRLNVTIIEAAGGGAFRGRGNPTQDSNRMVSLIEHHAANFDRGLKQGTDQGKRSAAPRLLQWLQAPE
jgi:hypothetical protein